MSENERNFRRVAEHGVKALISAGGIFLTGCIVYAAGGSVLWAWGGTITLAAFGVAVSIMFALTLRLPFAGEVEQERLRIRASLEELRDETDRYVKFHETNEPSSKGHHRWSGASIALDEAIARTDRPDDRNVPDLGNMPAALGPLRPMAEAGVPTTSYIPEDPPGISAKTIGEDELMVAIERQADLLTGDTSSPGSEAVFEWCRARDIDPVGLYRAAELCAEAWIEDKLSMRTHFQDSEWEIIVASYAYVLALGIEAERARRDSAELPS